MVLSTTKGTAEIPTTRIAGMRTEANPAVAAAHGAALQIRTIPQGCLQRQLILTNKRTGAVVLMPILAKRENFRDGYGKIARFSVKMLICFCISSSYSLDAKASRCRATRYRKVERSFAALAWPKAADKGAVRRAAEATFLVRDLNNTPAGDMGPAELAAAATVLARRHKAKCAVIVGDALLKMNYPAIHAVGRASDRAPRLIANGWTVCVN